VEDILLMLPGEMKELRSEGLQSYTIRTKAQIWVKVGLLGNPLDVG